MSSVLGKKSLLKLITFLAGAFFLVIASRGILSPYSYWNDELYSVLSSMDTWDQLYQNWILTDMHPPLYQVVLKFWIFFFGHSEIATRLLSFALSIFTLAVFANEYLREWQWRRAITFMLIAASPGFAYFSLETRSYALSLLLSSIITLTAVRIRQSEASKNDSGFEKVSTSARFLYYFACVGLSLTHYFGWIFVLTISIVNFFDRLVEPRRVNTLLLVATISIWPIWHLIFGTLGQKTGGNVSHFKVEPIIGTISNYLHGCLPFLGLRGSPILFIVAWALLLSLALVNIGAPRILTLQNLKQPSFKSSVGGESLFLLAILGTMILIMLVVDLHTPMSSARNYIVLLPLTMLLVGNGLSLLADGEFKSSGLKKVASVFLLLIFISLLLKDSVRQLSDKTGPRQNWKGLASYVRKHNLCSDGCFTLGSYSLHPYYFQGIPKITDLDQVVQADSNMPKLEFASQNKEAPLLLFLGQGDDLQSGYIMDRWTQSVCLEPIQSWKHSVAIVMPKNKLTGKERQEGMIDCSLSEAP